jgi:hypothetical protein
VENGLDSGTAARCLTLYDDEAAVLRESLVDAPENGHALVGRLIAAPPDWCPNLARRTAVTIQARSSFQPSPDQSVPDTFRKVVPRSPITAWCAAVGSRSYRHLLRRFRREAVRRAALLRRSGSPLSPERRRLRRPPGSRRHGVFQRTRDGDARRLFASPAYRVVQRLSAFAAHGAPPRR